MLSGGGRRGGMDGWVGYGIEVVGADVFELQKVGTEAHRPVTVILTTARVGEREGVETIGGLEDEE